MTQPNKPAGNTDQDAVEAAEKAARANAQRYFQPRVGGGEFYKARVSCFKDGVRWARENPEPASADLEERATNYSQAWAPDNKEAQNYGVTRAIKSVAWHAYKAGATYERKRIREKLREVRDALQSFNPLCPHDNRLSLRVKALAILDELLEEK